jgi:glycosyltransferase involved in cell wall biosynthesis
MATATALRIQHGQLSIERVLRNKTAASSSADRSRLKRASRLVSYVKVVVGIPAYNEEKTIAKIVIRAEKHSDLVIVCDDGSTDATAEIAEELGAKVVRHERNIGKGEALRTLFLEARKAGADVLVTLDADGQHDPNEIPTVVGPILRGEADLVVGSRLTKGGDQIPAARRLGNQALNRMTDGSVSDSQSGFRAYGGKAIEEIHPSEAGMGVDSEILQEASKFGMKITEVPISVDYNVPKASKQNPVYHFLDVIASLIKFLSIRHPLVFYGIPGLILVLAGVGFFLRSFSEISQAGVVTNLALTDGLVSFGLLLFGLLTAYTGIILFTLTTVIRRNRPQD